jgi:methenyltetrahydromethanopterin cyclohydrolase
MAAADIGVNARGHRLAEALIADAAALRLRVERLSNGTTVVDAGIGAIGGIEAGRRIAEICMGGLGRVNLRAADEAGGWTWRLDVSSANPVIACLASQYAGWSLATSDGAYRAMASGPARALGSDERLFSELGYRDRHDQGCLVLEVDRMPPAALAEDVAARCSIDGRDLILVVTPTTSLSGGVQIVARVLEVALHKAHELGFPLESIVDGAGSAPLCPPAPDFLTAMGRTNDAIIFAGDVHLFVDAADAEAEALARRLPSSNSPDFGRPFAQIFKEYDYDFYKVDKMLFSPSRAAVTSLRSGRTHRAGALAMALLQQSFGGAR